MPSCVYGENDAQAQHLWREVGENLAPTLINREKLLSEEKGACYVVVGLD